MKLGLIGSTEKIVQRVQKSKIFNRNGNMCGNTSHIAIWKSVSVLQFKRKQNQTHLRMSPENISNQLAAWINLNKVASIHD